MPKATAAWLIDHTSLTFQQIAEFTGLHLLEIESIANGESLVNPLDPIQAGTLTMQEIERCQLDESSQLQMLPSDLPSTRNRRDGPRYIPIAKRAEKPDAIAWLLKHHKTLSEHQIIRLIGTTKTTIAAIRERAHWNSSNLRPRNPVELGFCRYHELQEQIAIARKRHEAAAEPTRPGWS
ncbi:MAG: cell cycle transcriptional regulator TrcR, partial [Pseudomonadota bacterium]